MTVATGVSGTLRRELLLAMTVDGLIPQPVVGAVAATLVGECLDAMAGPLASLIGRPPSVDGACSKAFQLPDGRLLRLACLPGRVRVRVHPVAHGAEPVAVAEVATSHRVGAEWHRGHREVHDVPLALVALSHLRAALDARGLSDEAATASRTHAERVWDTPAQDRAAHAAIRYGVVLAEAHGHLPPPDALDDVHAASTALEARAALRSSASLFGHLLEGDTWSVPGLHLQAWRGDDRDVLCVVSTRGRHRHASLVTWQPRVDAEDCHATVQTLAGQGAPETHGTYRLAHGALRDVEAAPTLHHHAALRLLGHRTRAALRVVEAVRAVHDVHAILGVP